MHPVRATLFLLVSTLAIACGSKGTGTGGHGGHGGQGTGGHGTAGGTTGTGGHGGSAPACGTDAWSTYGHDARRTSASDGCVNGPLTTAWRYAPEAAAGKKVNAVFNAVAQSDAVFVEWSANNDPYLGTTAADRVDAAGQRVWTFDSGTDSNLGNWPSIAWTSLVLNEDGIYLLDLATGMKTGGNGVDDWGQTLTDGSRLYVVNDSHVDGPGIYVGAYDQALKQLWQQNTYGMCRIDAGDVAGGIALDGGTLFYAPSYSLGQGVMLSFSSGVYAFDPADGTQKWFQDTMPTSGISAGGGLVYLIESDTNLVARKQSDGTLAWSAPVTGPGTQAPVLAGGRVIVGTAQGVSAFDAATGKDAWTATVTGAAAQAFNLMFSGGCVAGSGQWSGNQFGTAVATTTLAAAAGNGTLVVTAFDGVHLLSIADGKETWTGMPAQASGPVRNPVIVGSTVYVVDTGGVLALKGM
ncbi:MAG: PQQ-binding-like beta-propeller repeat protein [Minicystis sp.]